MRLLATRATVPYLPDFSQPATPLCGRHTPFNRNAKPLQEPKQADHGERELASSALVPLGLAQGQPENLSESVVTVPEVLADCTIAVRA
jgi:hypothetical protein